MEVNINNAIQSANPTSSNPAGVSAPQTAAQRADVSATRVVSSAETASLENKASNAEDRRFEAVRSRAASYVGGNNPFLSDIKFTIYGTSRSTPVYEYLVRFTDLGSGAIETKTEAQLFAGSGGGELVSGQV